MISWRIILKWLLILFVLYLIFEIIRNIFGGSLSQNDVTLGLVIANVGYSFYLTEKISDHLGWHRGRKDA